MSFTLAARPCHGVDLPTSLRVLALLGHLALSGSDTLPAIPDVLSRDPRILAAARVLQSTPMGRRVLGRYAQAGYTVLVAGSETRAATQHSAFAAAAGRPPAFRTDHGGRWVALMDTTLPPAAIAVGLTHEVVHLLGGAAPGTREMGEEELRARNVALDFYHRCRPHSGRRLRRATKPTPDGGPNDPPTLPTPCCIYPGTPGCEARAPYNPAQGSSRTAAGVITSTW